MTQLRGFYARKFMLLFVVTNLNLSIGLIISRCNAIVTVSMPIHYIIDIVITSISMIRSNYENLYHFGAWFISAVVSAFSTIANNTNSSKFVSIKRIISETILNMDIILKYCLYRLQSCFYTILYSLCYTILNSVTFKSCCHITHGIITIKSFA